MWPCVWREIPPSRSEKEFWKPDVKPWRRSAAGSTRPSPISIGSRGISKICFPERPTIPAIRDKLKIPSFNIKNGAAGSSPARPGRSQKGRKEVRCFYLGGSCVTGNPVAGFRMPHHRQSCIQTGCRKPWCRGNPVCKASTSAPRWRDRRLRQSWPGHPPSDGIHGRRFRHHP